MPITCLENTVSSAECRALKNHEEMVVPRPADIYASMPSLTGKLELEYEGELRGADSVARDVIRQAIAKVFKKHFDNVPLQPVVQWFELGGSPQVLAQFVFAGSDSAVQEDSESAGENPVPWRKAKDDPALQAAAGEFILEGLYALKRISRNEELGYHTSTVRPSAASSLSPWPHEPRRRGLN